MTLGLTGGLAWSGNIISLSEPPQDNLVGHWDFTDYTQLSGALTGSFGSYLSGTDPIGRCKNKAPNVDGSATPKLGQWVKAIDNSKRPIFKTGGANGNTYAEFDNSSTTQALACRSTNTTWGAHGTDNLSSTRLTAENLSIFIVGEPLDDDTDGVLENVFSYFGYYDNTSGFSSSQSVEFSFERDDDDDTHATWKLGGVAPVSPNSINAVQAASHWSSGTTTIINIQTTTTLGGSHIYTNNVPDVGQNIFHPASGAFAQNNWCDFDPVDYDDSLTASIGIGGQVNSAGVITASSFEGKIYEILVYKEALSESDRTALTYYLGYKYNITISAG